MVVETQQRTALLFPGQGAQTVGMGQRAWQASDRARTLYARADDVLSYPLSRLCFDGPAETLRDTRWQQPALLITSLAIVAAVDDLAPVLYPAALCAAGHSLGEYTALVWAGALTLDDGLRLVQRRGALMQQAADREPGGMAAVLGIARSTLLGVCEEVRRALPGRVIVIANDNSPDQQVLSGHEDALALAGQMARERGARRVVPLSVVGAFHSPLMTDAAAEFVLALNEVAIQDPRVPVLANADGHSMAAAADVRRELLGQIAAPVLWTETVRAAGQMGATVAVDCGPGNVMSGLARRIDPQLTTIGLDDQLQRLALAAV